MYLKTFLFPILAFVCVVALEDMVYGETSQDMIEKGKLQYQLLQERGKMPRFGECWKSAVMHLHDGCKALSELAQSEIALRFTDCFLEMSGHDTYQCYVDKKPNVRAICISSMTDRAFNAYSEFYTHSQNICFFLRNQVWHEETEKIIDKLSWTSGQVNEKLEETSKQQDELLKQQAQSIAVQVELLKYGASLTDSLASSQHDLDRLMEEFKTSTLEQKRLLYDIFNRISALQSWIIGEVSWFDTVLFYFCTVCLVLLFTSTKKTADARVVCFLVLTFHVCVERYVCDQIITTYKNYDAEFVNSLIITYVWLCRKLTIAICLALFITCWYRFCDYNKANHSLLVKVHDQNNLIVRMLNTLTSNDIRNRITYKTVDVCDGSTEQCINEEPNVSSSKLDIIYEVRHKKRDISQDAFERDSSSSKSLSVSEPYWRSHGSGLRYYERNSTPKYTPKIKEIIPSTEETNKYFLRSSSSRQATPLR